MKTERSLTLLKIAFSVLLLIAFLPFLIPDGIEGFKEGYMSYNSENHSGGSSSISSQETGFYFT